MSGKGTITMSQKELRRVGILERVVEGELTQEEAGEVVGLTARQVRRLVKRVEDDGVGGLIHRSRGRISNRAIDSKLRARILGLYRTKYAGFGPTLAVEKLSEREGLFLSDETLRLWLKAEGIAYPKRRKRAHRRWRERKRHRGEMVQMDGSHHHWLEDRGPKFVLMGWIDDANGEVFGRFYEYEGTYPAMDSFKRYIKRYGLPMSVYVDRHSTYKTTGKATLEQELEGLGPLSQFERALGEMGVEVIHAYSPQAKGRIERLFKTFQDRLVKEMRLSDIRTLEEANFFLERYLPVYNKKFAVAAVSPADLHRKAPTERVLSGILCLKTERVVRKDMTVAYKGRLYQIHDRTRATRIVVEEHFDGILYITYQGKRLRHHEITTRPVKLKPTVPCSLKKKPLKPAPDHPWRKAFITRTQSEVMALQ